jgi:hypothetical protein
MGLNFTLGKLIAKEEICGLSFTGYKTESSIVKGVNITAIWSEINELKGFSFAGYNKITGVQNGLTIGLVNFAEFLNGIQIGLINIAENNPVPFKILPIINVNL